MIGYLYGILYIIAISASTIWLNHLGEKLSVPILLISATLIAIIFFNGVRFHRIKKNHKAILYHPLHWFTMSASLLALWGLTYYGAVESSAQFIITAAMLTQALCATIMQKNKVISIILFIAYLVVYFASSNTLFIGIIGFLTGVFCYLYGRTSISFSKISGLAAMDILAIRFYLLLLFSIVYYVYMTPQPISQIGTMLSSHAIIISLLLLGLTNMVIPNFLSQSSMIKLGMTKFSFLVTLLPIVTLVLEGIIFSQWSLYMIIACSLASLTLIIYTFIDATGAFQKA